MEERTYRLREYGCLGIVLAVNCFLLYQSILIFQKKPVLDSPGIFPLILSSVMVLLALALLISAKKDMPDSVEKFHSPGELFKAAVKEELPRNGIVAFLAVIVYVVLMNFIGFLVSTFGFTAGLILYLNPTKWKSAVLASAIVTVSIYIVFGLIFRVRLP